MGKRKCPKCKRLPTYYTEFFKDHSIGYFTDIDGEVYGEQTVSMHPGDPYCVYAHCECGYKWKLKGISQITDVPGYYC